MITDPERVVTPDMLDIAHKAMKKAYDVHCDINTSTSELIYKKARDHWYTFRRLCSASGYAIL